jgi:hypothetical protein
MMGELDERIGCQVRLHGKVFRGIPKVRKLVTLAPGMGPSYIWDGPFPGQFWHTDFNVAGGS